MEQTYVLMQRTYYTEIDKEQRIEFAFEREGNMRNLCAPKKNLKDLALSIIKNNIKINMSDLIITPRNSRFNPNWGYVESPVSAEQILEFYKHYQTEKISKAPLKFNLDRSLVIR